MDGRSFNRRGGKQGVPVYNATLQDKVAWLMNAMQHVLLALDMQNVAKNVVQLETTDMQEEVERERETLLVQSEQQRGRQVRGRQVRGRQAAFASMSTFLLTFCCHSRQSIRRHPRPSTRA